MISPKLQKEKQDIDDLFTLVTNFRGDPYIKALLTYYLCVRVSGFIENCVRIIFTEYSAPRTRDHVSVYVNKRLEKFPNPTYENICRLTREFNNQWHQTFKAGVTQQVRQSLGSINVNRNAIAHGGTSTITVGQLYSYYQDIIQLIAHLEQACV
jgi:hypothetical protein